MKRKGSDEIVSIYSIKSKSFKKHTKLLTMDPSPKDPCPYFKNQINKQGNHINTLKRVAELNPDGIINYLKCHDLAEFKQFYIFNDAKSRAQLEKIINQQVTLTALRHIISKLSLFDIIAELASYSGQKTLEPYELTFKEHFLEALRTALDDEAIFRKLTASHEPQRAIGEIRQLLIKEPLAKLYETLLLQHFSITEILNECKGNFLNKGILPNIAAAIKQKALAMSTSDSRIIISDAIYQLIKISLDKGLSESLNFLEDLLPQRYLQLLDYIATLGKPLIIEALSEIEKLLGNACTIYEQQHDKSSKDQLIWKFVELALNLDSKIAIRQLPKLSIKYQVSLLKLLPENQLISEHRFIAKAFETSLAGHHGSLEAEQLLIISAFKVYSPVIDDTIINNRFQFKQILATTESNILSHQVITTGLSAIVSAMRQHDVFTAQNSLDLISYLKKAPYAIPHFINEIFDYADLPTAVKLIRYSAISGHLTDSSQIAQFMGDGFTKLTLFKPEAISELLNILFILYLSFEGNHLFYFAQVYNQMSTDDIISALQTFIVEYKLGKVSYANNACINSALLEVLSRDDVNTNEIILLVDELKGKSNILAHNATIAYVFNVDIDRIATADDIDQASISKASIKKTAVKDFYTLDEYAKLLFAKIYDSNLDFATKAALFHEMYPGHSDRFLDCLKHAEDYHTELPALFNSTSIALKRIAVTDDFVSLHLEDSNSTHHLSYHHRGTYYSLGEYCIADKFLMMNHQQGIIEEPVIDLSYLSNSRLINMFLFHIKIAFMSHIFGQEITDRNITANPSYMLDPKIYESANPWICKMIALNAQTFETYLDKQLFLNLLFQSDFNEDYFHHQEREAYYLTLALAKEYLDEGYRPSEQLSGSKCILLKSNSKAAKLMENYGLEIDYANLGFSSKIVENIENFYENPNFRNRLLDPIYPIKNSLKNLHAPKGDTPKIPHIFHHIHQATTIDYEFLDSIFKIKSYIQINFDNSWQVYLWVENPKKFQFLDSNNFVIKGIFDDENLFLHPQIKNHLFKLQGGYNEKVFEFAILHDYGGFVGSLKATTDINYDLISRTYDYFELSFLEFTEHQVLNPNQRGSKPYHPITVEAMYRLQQSYEKEIYSFLDWLDIMFTPSKAYPEYKFNIVENNLNLNGNVDFVYPPSKSFVSHHISLEGFSFNSLHIEEFVDVEPLYTNCGAASNDFNIPNICYMKTSKNHEILKVFEKHHNICFADEFYSTPLISWFPHDSY